MSGGEPTGGPFLTDRQRLNELWWSGQPMTYEGRGEPVQTPGTRAWFDALDRRFLEAAWFARGPHGEPFGRFLGPALVNDAAVLEIGCGMGTHAELLARAGARLTAVDLTEAAVAMTRRRFELRGLEGRVDRADAEQLPFETDSFDVVWSWGVLHHSDSFEGCLAEVTRVLRPGGRLMIMVYHRPSLRYEIHACLVRGVLMGQRRHRSFQEIYESQTDGAFARLFRRAEMRALLSRDYDPVAISVAGQRAELFPIPASRLKSALERFTPDRLAEAILSRLGFFLIAEATLR